MTDCFIIAVHTTIPPPSSARRTRRGSLWSIPATSAQTLLTVARKLEEAARRLEEETLERTEAEARRIEAEAEKSGYRIQRSVHLVPGLVEAGEVAELRDFLVAVERHLDRRLESP